mmetsp:Transcript_4793/g.13551  ORF Transcript_4793/g.13551 Transcript_4793/m.13551 type:complete len:93 (-) Transcript_4793:73-351(-)
MLLGGQSVAASRAAKFPDDGSRPLIKCNWRFGTGAVRCRCFKGSDDESSIFVSTIVTTVCLDSILINNELVTDGASCGGCGGCGGWVLVMFD